MKTILWNKDQNEAERLIKDSDLKNLSRIYILMHSKKPKNKFEIWIIIYNILSLSWINQIFANPFLISKFFTSASNFILMV